jgi:3'-5' exoribonuclease
MNKQPRLNNPKDALAYLEMICRNTFVIHEQTDKVLGKYQTLVRMVLDMDEFKTVPGSVNKHHQYAGGLLTHTAQVMSGALGLLGGMVIGARIPEVVVAVIYHDLGKCWDYDQSLGEWSYTDHKYLVGHLAKSAQIFYHRAVAINLPTETIDFISHLILAHHGRREWGSPVEANCTEAWAVHAADMMSAWYTTDATGPRRK